jgi:hypothetical protein
MLARNSHTVPKSTALPAHLNKQITSHQSLLHSLDEKQYNYFIAVLETITLDLSL